MKHFLLTLMMAVPFCGITAQSNDGGISPQMLENIRGSHAGSAADRALRNALAANSINELAAAHGNPASTDTYFSHRVNSRGITDQKSSGRCWLFTGMNVMRAKAIARFGMGEFQFSQSYSFFYDQLEKSNLFLQSIIETANRPMDDRLVEWLFKNPLSDGGQFTGVQDIITKYGLVPAEVMPESHAANNTSRMAEIISTKLREYGLTLRSAAEKGEKRKQLLQRKTEMLGTVYHILSLCLGEPPTEFEWTRRTPDGRPVETKKYTPLSFYQEYVGADLKGGYVMLMNDPTRPYHKTYTIDLDRHMYDGANWTYINLPMDEIKAMAIASIKDSVMMYFSCDVGKCYTKSGILSLDNYDYASLMGTDFPMNKADRIRTYTSASSHAMTLMAVDLDSQGNPTKWMVENSWGPTSGHKGHIIMTDDWFDEYMFRLVVERKYVPAETLELLKQKPVKLPAWDPLFAPEQ
ncbi:MAG: C1 family peptidase [Bacteroidaceae bacterium]|nr:C1 family peptidase [Bacteroidaceae bacterium]